MRHWLQFWQLRTWIHDNLCYLTIKSDIGQHSQFLRCLLMIYYWFYLYSAFSTVIFTFTLSLLPHCCTGTRSKSCFGGLIEQSGYLVLYNRLKVTFFTQNIKRLGALVSVGHCQGMPLALPSAGDGIKYWDYISKELLFVKSKDGVTNQEKAGPLPFGLPLIRLPLIGLPPFGLKTFGLMGHLDYPHLD